MEDKEVCLSCKGELGLPGKTKIKGRVCSRNGANASVENEGVKGLKVTAAVSKVGRWRKRPCLNSHVACTSRFPMSRGPWIPPWTLASRQGIRCSTSASGSIWFNIAMMGPCSQSGKGVKGSIDGEYKALELSGMEVMGLVPQLTLTGSAAVTGQVGV